jgi:hypothetical protein
MSRASLIISIVALFISLLTSYYSLFDERYDLKVMFSLAQPVLASRDGIAITAEDYTITFANSGNRPVSILRISYVVQPSDRKFDELNPFNCEITMFAPDAFGRAEPEHFHPIVVKPNEIEVNTYSFHGHIPAERAEAFLGQHKHLLSCILIEFFTPNYGNATEIIPHAWSPSVMGGGSFFTEVKPFHAVQPIQLIRVRWPFSFKPVAFR